MKKALVLLLIFCLLLTACSVGTASSTPAAPELLPQTPYTVTATALQDGLSVREQRCMAGSTLYFLADAPAAQGEHTVADTEEVLTYDVFESRLYKLDLVTGEMTLLKTYPTAATTDAEAYSAVTALFPGKDDSLWVLENTTHYIFDLPRNFDETVQDKWEYYQYRGNSTVLRQLDAQGRDMTAITLTNLQSSLGSAVAWGDKLLCTQGTSLLVLQTDGTVVSTIPAPGWVTALHPLGGEVLVFAEHEDDGVCRLYTLGEDMTFTEGKELPTTISQLSGFWGNTLYFTDRGNLFSWDTEASAGQKLLDWQDYDRNRSHIYHLQVLEDGSLAALYQPSAGEKLELLQLTEAEEGTLPHTDLTLGVLYPDLSTMDLVLSFNAKAGGKRIRVADYSEYDAMGLRGPDMLQRDLTEGRSPDMLFSADRQSPVTDLAPGHLEDLSSYLSSDAVLNTQGLMTSVFDALRGEDGKLHCITPSFHLSTTIGKSDVLTPTPLTVSQTVLLSGTAVSDGFAPTEPYATRNSALLGHLSRRADDYFQDGQCTLEQETFLQGMEFVGLYPESIDWKAYEKKGIREGWMRVRQGSQLYISGTYSSFSALAQAMSSVGDTAVLAGWPDTPGGHAIEVWETWGMTTNCQDKTLAWNFLRQLLTDQIQTSLYIPGLPTNRTSFQRLGRAAMQSGTVSFHPMGDEIVEISARLTEAQYAKILDAVDSAKNLSRYVSPELATVAENALKDYFAGLQSPEDAVAAAQLSINAYLTPDSAVAESTQSAGE